MKPKNALIVLTAINYLNYIDRLLLAALLGSIKTELSLSDFEAGLLATMFMVPYMLTSPLFGYLGDTQNRSKIIALGAGLWSVATFCTGLARNYTSLLFTRLGLGIGESAFTTIAMPYLAEHYPSEKHGRVFAIFNTASPVGAALGYLLGGLLGAWVGWRNAFLLVGIPGIILSLIIWRAKDPRHTIEAKFDARMAMKTLLSSRSYLFAVAGFCAYTFVLGGVAHWIPSFIQRIFLVDQLKANAYFGGLAVVMGLFGTLSGGFLADRLLKKNPGANQLIPSLSMFLATPAFWFAMTTDSLSSFMVFMGLTLFFLFVAVSPINIAMIEAIPLRFRNSAMAMAILACHLLGDAFSAPIMGYVSDQTGSLRSGVLISTPVIALAGILWFVGAGIRRKEMK